MSEERKSIIDKTGEELLNEVVQAIEYVLPGKTMLRIMESTGSKTIEESAAILSGFIIFMGAASKDAMAKIMNNALELACRAIVMRERDGYEE